ncbi:LOW QUALITY PROTEIN: uncharacterized protein LOC115418106 [Sphaeramia orbicularis]|uniref:LOW QUALITY PROTEIN: uncharacterized protein LOC115418106 n=1 Tax=Sphaeramia orbicularis TaxID=375764 RepID=UPI001180D987|nr:LOW QUALITY PROTEIN: uncharacterized protein LOC115418106 [Sphaeramia orbicularis]
MDNDFQKQLYSNGLSYKRSLERIIAKYSKLQDQDGGIEVDLNKTNIRTFHRYMRQAKKKLDELESMSQADSREESIESQDITRDSQLAVSHHEERDCEMSVQLLSDQDDALPRSESSEMTWSLLDESQRNISEMELQPEDDEQEMSLKRQGSCLADLYPNMISQIGKAWRRQHVSEAADSVLRRYRKWRHLSNKSNLSTISNTTLRKTSSNSNKTKRKPQINKTINSPFKKLFLGNKGAEAAPLSPLRIENYVKDCQAQHHHHHSPGKGIGLQRREQQPPVLVMDLSSHSSEETLLKRTFTISYPSPQRSQPSAYTVSPSQPCYPTAKAQDISFRSKGSSLSPLLMQTAGCSIYESESPASKKKPYIYGSPVRQSPFKARLMSREGLGGIPHAFSVSPKSYSPSYSRELKRPRSASTFLSSPPQTSTAPLRMLHYQDSCPIVQSQVHPPLSPIAVGHHRRRRRLSFDSSSLPSNRVSYSAKDLDNDFIKLYHKFVCQSKSPFLSRPPCRLCETNSEASRGHSSSALAALALSPHRSLLRKRHREEKLDDHLQSKCSKEQYYTYSPGSKRYFRVMLSRRFLPSELVGSHGNSRTASVNTPVLQNSAPRRSGSLESRPVYMWS